jgi:S1-C subfamily serine protease
MLPELEKVLRRDGAELGIALAPSQPAAELTLFLTGAGMGRVPTGDSGPPPFFLRALLIEGRRSQSLSATAPNAQRSARELVKLVSLNLDDRRLSVLRHRLDWPAVGLDFRALEKAERKQLKIKDGEVLVLSVEPNGPAWTSGLRAADIVVRLAGRKLENSGELASALYTAAPGSSLSLEVYRQSGNQTLTLTLP